MESDESNFPKLEFFEKESNHQYFLQTAKFNCDKCKELTQHRRYEIEDYEEDGRPAATCGYACEKCGNLKFDHIFRDPKF